jgi:hypothetical protein
MSVLLYKPCSHYDNLVRANPNQALILQVCRSTLTGDCVDFGTMLKTTALQTS